jgi:hypothetical protein
VAAPPIAFQLCLVKPIIVDTLICPGNRQDRFTLIAIRKVNQLLGRFFFADFFEAFGFGRIALQNSDGTAGTEARGAQAAKCGG